jgi:dTDP-4-amino-4,6-dideoxygalactose transaminase
MNRIFISKPNITEAEKDAVMAVLESGHLAQGPRTAEFEAGFAAMIGVRHAVAVANGTCALQIALMSEGIGPGDEVITTPFTFMATISTIFFTGARPVFVDIQEDTYNIDQDQIEAAITPRTRAILPVHLYGQLCDMDRIMAIAEKYELRVIEDACQAVLANDGQRYAGGFGTGTFSFYATKNLMTGEGGMITTNDDAVAERARMLRNHGMKQRYYHDTLGFNYRMTDIQAAIGLAQMSKLADMTRRRRENAAYLNARLHTVRTPSARLESAHVWHQYTVRFANQEKRDAAVKQLGEAGIDTGIYYPIPAHRQKSIAAMVGEVHCPAAEEAARQVLSLPVHPLLSTEDLDRIVEKVNEL